MERALRLEQYSPLHMAVIHGTIKTIETILEHGADINSLDANGFTPLMAAVAIQRPNVVRLLIKKGSNVNSASTCRRTPLVIAIKNLNFAVIKDLIDAGADPNLSDTRGRTPLLKCFKYRNHNNSHVVKALLKAGAQVNHANKEGVTSLMKAAQLAQFSAVSMLLEAGADINAMDIYNKNALLWTTGASMALFLVNNRITSDYPDKQGNRPIDCAVKVGYYAKIRLLLGSDCQRSSAILDDPKLVKARKKCPPFDQWLQQEILEPRSLKRLCRGVIRHSLSPFNTTRISDLPLPGALKDYLLAKEMTYESLICDRPALGHKF